MTKFSKKNMFIILFVVTLTAFGIFFLRNPESREQLKEELSTDLPQLGEDEEMTKQEPYPLSIDALRSGKYPGSEFVYEETLENGSNYQRYVVSYQSEGNKIYALLTIPSGEKPSTGWPVIIFNHGYIPPDQYRTTERYIAYVDGFARNQYIVLRPDYRGHGDSEGEAEGGYGSNAYTIDVLNAVASIKKHSDVDVARIGMWGHSMGGHITLRNMVVSKDVKAGVIWAGVVGSYADLLNNWRRRNTIRPTLPGGARRWRDTLVEQYGQPEENPQFWDSISSTAYLADLSGPVQIHHGTADTSVPVEFSELLDERVKKAGKVSELYIYEGDDHNLGANFSVAMRRSVEFFDKYVK